MKYAPILIFVMGMIFSVAAMADDKPRFDYLKKTMQAHADHFRDGKVQVGTFDQGHMYAFVSPQSAFYSMSRKQKAQHLSMYCLNKYDPRWQNALMPKTYRVTFGLESGLLAVECVRPY